MKPIQIFNLLEKVETKKRNSLSLLKEIKFENGLEEAMRSRIYKEYFESYKKILGV